MKRWLVVVLVLCGCGRKLPEVQKDIDAAKASEAALQLEVNRIAAELTETERGQDSERSRLTRVTRILSALQPVAVRSWMGEPSKLAAKKKAHPMPAELAAALDAAQANAKDLTAEKRFEKALAEGNLVAAGEQVDGWEMTDFPYEEEEVKSCEAKEPALECRRDPKRGLLLCDASADDVTWLLWTEHGVLRALSAPLSGVEVVERPASGVWVLQKAAHPPQLFETQGRASGPLHWVLGLGNEKGTAKPTLTWKNVDNDPFPEGLLELDGTVRLLDVVSSTHVTALDELDSCRRLSALGALPDAAKAGCATREAALVEVRDAGP
jgi:hypothetical protein